MLRYLIETIRIHICYINWCNTKFTFYFVIIVGNREKKICLPPFLQSSSKQSKHTGVDISMLLYYLKIHISCFDSAILATRFQLLVQFKTLYLYLQDFHIKKIHNFSYQLLNIKNHRLNPRTTQSSSHSSAPQ